MVTCEIFSDKTFCTKFYNFLDVLNMYNLHNLHNLQLLEALDWKLMNEKDPVKKVCFYNF
jgi:hypothetical protein